MKEYEPEKDILLIGAGGHAKVIIETILKNHQQFNIIGITDSDKSKTGHKLLDIPIKGTDEILQELYDCGLRKVFISLGMVKDYHPREAIYNLVKKIGFECINVIDGTSIISESAVIGEGSAILAGTIINTGVKIGYNCIINTGSIIEHDCIIGNNVHIAPGVKMSGQVKVGGNCMVGIGSTIIQGVTIGENSVIGAGSVVINDIPRDSVAVGVPARVIKKG